MYPVKIMVLMYITHFKLFGQDLPFWRKMLTKLKVRSENAPGITFFRDYFFLVCFDWCRNFDFDINFWSHPSFFLKSKHSFTISVGQSVQLNL